VTAYLPFANPKLGTGSLDVLDDHVKLKLNNPCPPQTKSDALTVNLRLVRRGFYLFFANVNRLTNATHARELNSKEGTTILLREGHPVETYYWSEKPH
jgi:hypothetical protein